MRLVHLCSAFVLVTAAGCDVGGADPAPLTRPSPSPAPPAVHEEAAPQPAEHGTVARARGEAPAHRSRNNAAPIPGSPRTTAQPVANPAMSDEPAVPRSPPDMVQSR